MSISPTQRTLAECRKRGYTVQVVEHWNAFARRRIDLFGVIDLVCLIPPSERSGGLCCMYKKPYDSKPGDYTCPTCGVTNDQVPGRIIGIQACAGSSHAARRTKIAAEPRAKLWVDAGAKLEIWSWSKTGERGKLKRWTLRTEEVTA